MLAPWKKSYDKPRQHIKKQRHYFANKVPSVKAIVFPVVMYAYEKVKLLSHVQLFETNIQKTKIVASGPITSWEIDGETVETVADFIFLGSKITADGDFSHEIKRCLLFGRTQPRQYIIKQRHCFANKGLSSQSYGFSSSHV